jgi:hypothetical protein
MRRRLSWQEQPRQQQLLATLVLLFGFQGEQILTDVS